jgi:hypothetical protein
VLDRLPCDTAAVIRVQLTSLDPLEVQIEDIEDRTAAAAKPSPELRLLRTVPGIGEIPHRHPPARARPEQLRPGSAKRETRLTGKKVSG